jgi:hypothetical protein
MLTNSPFDLMALVVLPLAALLFYHVNNGGYHSNAESLTLASSKKQEFLSSPIDTGKGPTANQQ